MSTAHGKHDWDRVVGCADPLFKCLKCRMLKVHRREGGMGRGGRVATARLEKIIGARMAACYTFGSPRVGNGNYKQDIKTPIYRIVHSTDIVTLVPNFVYTHAGDPRFISWYGNVIIGIPIWQRALEMLIALWPFNWARWVSSHDMSAYVAKLGAYAEFRNRK